MQQQQQYLLMQQMQQQLLDDPYSRYRCQGTGSGNDYRAVPRYWWILDRNWDWRDIFICSFICNGNWAYNIKIIANVPWPQDVTQSAFSGRGKKTAWATWESFGDATDAFYELAQGPLETSLNCHTTTVLRNVCSWFMTEQAALTKWIIPENICSTKKG